MSIGTWIFHVSCTVWVGSILRNLLHPIITCNVPKFLLSSAHNRGRQSVSKDTEITILLDGMTVELVTISVKSTSTLILHQSVIMGKSFYSLLPYLCLGYPRLTSQELAFYHAYSGGWPNRCGIPWPLPACHATYLLAVFIIVHRWTLQHNQPGINQCI